MLEIHPAARKHGVANADIEHAVSHPMSIDDHDDHIRLYLGAARNAELLEVATHRPSRPLRACDSSDEAEAKVSATLA